MSPPIHCFFINFLQQKKHIETLIFWVPVINDGYTGCTSTAPCSHGQGDCDSDDDCAGSLICFQRSYGELMPGLDFDRVRFDFDVCVDMGNYPPKKRKKVNLLNWKEYFSESDTSIVLKFI